MRIHQHPPVLEIFTRHNWMGYFEKLRGYDDEVARDFSLSIITLTRTHVTLVVRGPSIEFSTELISKITTLPVGVRWRKEDKGNSQTAKRKFFLLGEKHIEHKNGVRRTSLPYPWNEVSFHLIKYISCEVRFSVVYGYHFRVLE